MKDPEKQKRDWQRNKYDPSRDRKKEFKTDAGIPLDPLYLPNQSQNYEKDNGFPGEFPFTRGVQPSMYRSRFWTMRQYAGFGSAEETNQRFKYLLESGTTGLSVAFDLPTQMGYDSDHLLAEGEVGKVGVPVSSLQDMEILLEGIPLENVSTSMTINSTAAILLALYIVVAEKQGIDQKDLSGTIQNDLLKEYIARGTYIYPPDASMRIITDIFSYCAQNMPRWNTISISGYHIREAGSDAVQEVAFTLANAIAYVQAAIGAGLDVDNFASRLSFFFNAHNNFFEEIAKFRAARKMWATIMKNRFKAKDEKSLRMRFHAQTGGSTLTAQQPENNIIRVTLQAVAAVLGGTQSLHTNSFDEALALPTEDSVRIALRTQQIIAHESGIADTCDPLAGSYLTEFLTKEIEKRAYVYIDQIDKMGGSVEAIKKGFFQNEISKRAYEYQKELESNEKVVVGLNKYVQDENPDTELLKINEDMIRKQVKRIREYKINRDYSNVSAARQHLESDATGNINLIPAIINCVKSHVTLGEISESLRTVFGSYEDHH
jgi:methylmalonyl-CoA mutase N-terminal domain/subunit